MAGGKRRWHGGGGGGHAKRARPQQDGAAAKADDEWLLGGTRGGATAADLKSDVLTRFYAAQTKVVTSPDEWEQILEAYRRPLNLTFRVADTGDGEAADTVGRLRGVCERVRQADSAAAAPRPVPWWPRENLCWEAVGTSRTSLARDAKKAGSGSAEGGGGGGERELFRFLVGESERGSVSRQEIVSMIPPLFLDARSDHFVLDCCAAPGNKTKQIMEALALDARTRGESCVSGCVVANDLNAKRCDILVTQTQRLRDVYPSTLVTNHNAALYPMPLVGVPGEGVAAHTVNGNPAEGRYLRRKQFDRILADVVCSGDGTFRKSLNLWKSWDPTQAYSVHKTQVNILLRCMDLVKEGGKIVYSTCSLNPVEDEAVLAHCLRTAKHEFELQDCSDYLPGLERSAGVDEWCVTDRTATRVYKTHADVPPEDAGMISASMFPHADNAPLNLSRAMRFKPHTQDTGGFFVAVLVKQKEGKAEKPWFVPKDAAWGDLVAAGDRRVKAQDVFRRIDEAERPHLHAGLGASRDAPACYATFVRRTAKGVHRTVLLSATAAEVIDGMNLKQSTEQKPYLKLVAGGLRIGEGAAPGPLAAGCSVRPAPEAAAFLVRHGVYEGTRRAAGVPRALLGRLVSARTLVLRDGDEAERRVAAALDDGVGIVHCPAADGGGDCVTAAVVAKTGPSLHLTADAAESLKLRAALGVDDAAAPATAVVQAAAGTPAACVDTEEEVGKDQPVSDAA